MTAMIKALLFVTLLTVINCQRNYGYKNKFTKLFKHHHNDIGKQGFGKHMLIKNSKKDGDHRRNTGRRVEEALGILNEIKTEGVKIKKPCQKEPLGNLALGKATKQSSLWQDQDIHRPKMAVDGNTGDYDEETGDFVCAHTCAEPESWWSVDLQQDHVIQTVEVVNRKTPPNGLQHLNHYFVDNLRDFTISVSKDEINWQTCIVHDGPLTTPKKDQQLFECKSNPIGRYVRIQKHDNNALILCEVFVSGYQFDPFCY